MKNKMWKKLYEPRIWRRIYLERMGEPLIYNVASVFALLFGSFKQKVHYDLVPRQPYAFCIQAAADKARAENIGKLTLIEFGVAAGAGLQNMCWIAERVGRESGVEFEIIGFDGGEGMPPPKDYRDRPEKYFTGDYRVTDKRRLLEHLPGNARIMFGHIDDSIRKFSSQIRYPIGFVSLDVDYYWSTKQCLEIFNLEAKNYLPFVYTYFDDIQDIDDNEFCGELLAIKEFNQSNANQNRKIAIANCLDRLRVFKNGVWLKQVYLTHIFDHEHRSIEFVTANRKSKAILTNPYL
jgi:hypothetical protein